jgi:hypothetical protein
MGSIIPNKREGDGFSRRWSINKAEFGNILDPPLPHSLENTVSFLRCVYTKDFLGPSEP